MGIISEVLPTFSRKPLFGYPIIVFSGAVIGFLGFAVWSHHMFTTGLGKLATAAFAMTTMAIAVPTGVKIFNWIGTLWGGKLLMRTPMLYALGLHLDVHDGRVHRHHALGGARGRPAAGQLLRGRPFPLRPDRRQSLRPVRGHLLLAAQDHGPDRQRGHRQARILDHLRRLQHRLLPHAFPGAERHAAAHLHLRGQHGLEPLELRILHRRLSARYRGCHPRHPHALHHIKGKKAEGDPWNGRTLEWSISSPPAEYNFDAIPVVRARDTHWHEKHADTPAPANPDTAAEKEQGVHMPDQSWYPFFAAMGHGDRRFRRHLYHRLWMGGGHRSR